MPKFLLRLVVLVLVPCLVTDPMTAYAFDVAPAAFSESARVLSCFDQQALAPNDLSEIHPLLRQGVPFVGVLLVVAFPAISRISHSFGLDISVLRSVMGATGFFLSATVLAAFIPHTVVFGATELVTSDPGVVLFDQDIPTSVFLATTDNEYKTPEEGMNSLMSLLGFEQEDRYTYRHETGIEIPFLAALLLYEMTHNAFLKEHNPAVHITLSWAARSEKNTVGILHLDLKQISSSDRNWQKIIFNHQNFESEGSAFLQDVGLRKLLDAGNGNVGLARFGEYLTHHLDHSALLIYQRGHNLPHPLNTQLYLKIPAASKVHQVKVIPWKAISLLLLTVLPFLGFTQISMSPSPGVSILVSLLWGLGMLIAMAAVLPGERPEDYIVKLFRQLPNPAAQAELIKCMGLARSGRLRPLARSAILSLLHTDPEVRKAAEHLRVRLMRRGEESVDVNPAGRPVTLVESMFRKIFVWIIVPVWEDATRLYVESKFGIIYNKSNIVEPSQRVQTGRQAFLDILKNSAPHRLPDFLRALDEIPPQSAKNPANVETWQWVHEQLRSASLQPKSKGPINRSPSTRPGGREAERRPPVNKEGEFQESYYQQLKKLGIEEDDGFIGIEMGVVLALGAVALRYLHAYLADPAVIFYTLQSLYVFHPMGMRLRTAA